ncbi:MAG: hypothetical protein AAB548_02865 [Patescibacteria group bacterium]
MQTSAFKFLPFVLAVLVVVGAVTFASQKLISKKKIEGIFTKLPEPTPFVTVKPFRGDSANAVPTPSPTATPVPVVVAEEVETKGGLKKAVSLKTSTETVCTPVYGMANTCAEHAVVDTGLATNAFYNLAALSYFGGLAAFIKAKRTG